MKYLRAYGAKGIDKKVNDKKNREIYMSIRQIH